MANTPPNKKKLAQWVTSVGTARYPKLITPDTKFNADGVYSVDLVLDPADVDDVVAYITTKAEEALAFFQDVHKAKAKRMKLASDSPIREIVDKDGEPTGDTAIRAKLVASGTRKDGTPWTDKPRIYDSKGVLLKNPPNVGGGSRLRLDLDVFGYYAAKDNAVGITLGLRGVQIIKLEQYGTRESGFGEVDDGWTSSDDDASGFGQQSDSAQGDQDDGSGDF